MIENIATPLASLAGASKSPTTGTSFQSMGGVDYLIGSLLILLGFLMYFAFHKKAKRNLEKYKKDQLDLYNKNRGTKVTDYSRTSLYVPFGVRAKTSAPVMLMVLFIFMGLSWIIWTATGTPLTTL